MFFNPRIEAWLYRVTNTTSPEYKSELHANNGKKNGYSKVPGDDSENTEFEKNKEKDDLKEVKEDNEENKKEEEKETKPVFSGKISIWFSNIRVRCTCFK